MHSIKMMNLVQQTIAQRLEEHTRQLTEPFERSIENTKKVQDALMPSYLEEMLDTGVGLDVIPNPMHKLNNALTETVQSLSVPLDEWDEPDDMIEAVKEGQKVFIEKEQRRFEQNTNRLANELSTHLHPKNTELDETKVEKLVERTVVKVLAKQKSKRETQCKSKTRTMQISTRAKLIALCHERVRNPNITITAACDLAGINYKTVKTHKPEIAELWSNDDYWSYWSEDLI